MSHRWSNIKIDIFQMHSTILLQVLVLELCHTFGLCLLVFRVMPLFDMLRALIVLGSIYTIPAMLKTIFELSDKSLTRTRKFVVFILNTGVATIQLGSILGCCFFGIAMSNEEKMSLRYRVISSNVTNLITRPPLSNQPNWIWELPLGLVFVSLSYWENFVDGDLVIFRRTIRFQNWKKYLHHCRPRLYIIASIWKIAWVIVFSKLLQPGFTFNMAHSALSVNTHMPDLNLNNTTNQTEATGVDLGSLAEAEIFNPFQFSGETVKHFELYGILYIQLFSVVILTYSASTACQMCMQIFGFSLPLILSTPVSAAVVVLQCMFKFLPTGVFVWVSYEEDGDVWILHLVWLVVLWLSELFIVSHVWFPNNNRMEKTDR